MAYFYGPEERKELVDYLDSSNYSRLTKKSYLEYIDLFFRKYPQMDSRTLRLFLDKYGGTTSTAAIKFFHTWLLRNEKVDENDIAFKFEKVYSGKVRTPVSVSHLEVLEIINQMPSEKEKLLTKFIYYGAFRISESLGLTWGDLGWFNWLIKKDGEIIVTLKESKKGTNETTTLPPKMAMELFNLNTPFLDSRGMPYNDKSLIIDLGLERYSNKEEYIDCMRHNYKHTLKKISHAAIGKAISPHKLRHSYAQHLIDSGVPIQIVSRKLRHKNLSTTQIYVKTSLKQLAEHENRLND